MPGSGRDGAIRQQARDPDGRPLGEGESGLVALRGGAVGYAVYYSDDDGRTWRGSRSGKPFVWDEASMTWSRATEPTVAEVAPGRLRVVPVSWLYGGPERMKRNGFFRMLERRFPREPGAAK